MADAYQRYEIYQEGEEKRRTQREVNSRKHYISDLMTQEGINATEDWDFDSGGISAKMNCKKRTPEMSSWWST